MFRILGTVALFALGSCTALAQVVRQVTDVPAHRTTEMALSDDGSVGFFVSNDTPGGTSQVFRWERATGEVTAITSLQFGVDAFASKGVSVSDDGGIVVFSADGRLAKVNGDGSGFLQLTVAPTWTYELQVAGNGSRAVFSSSEDLVGANPNRLWQVYAVETDGTGLRQLSAETNWGWDFRSPSISDDGERVAWVTAENPGVAVPRSNVAAVLQDGTQRRFLTSLSDFRPRDTRISGNGASVVFVDESTYFACNIPSDPNPSLAIVDWDGTGLARVRCSDSCSATGRGAEIRTPDLSDDAETIVYWGYDGSQVQDACGGRIWRIRRDGTGRTNLTRTGDEPGPTASCAEVPAISGDGSWVSFTCSGGEPWGGPNPDLGEETFTATSSATEHEQVSDGGNGDSFEVATTGDGSQIVFVSDSNPAGAPGYWLEQVYRSAADGTGLVPLTSFTDWTTRPRSPAIDDAGNVVVFERASRVWSVRGDGTQLRELVEAGPAIDPHVSADGSTIVFVGLGDPLGEGGITGDPVYRAAPDGSGLARISSKTGIAMRPRLDAGGAWIVYRVKEGTRHEVHLQRVDGTQDRVVASGATAAPGWTDVSAGGALVVYESHDDPAGENPDRSLEIFVWEAAAGTVRQLTRSGEGQSRQPRISRDGSRVYFWSDARLLGETWPDVTPYRVRVADLLVERVGGLSACIGFLGPESPGATGPVAIDGAGSRAFYAADLGCTFDNPDGNAELYVTDYTVTPRIVVSSGAAPTTLTWDVEPGIDTYDVIRGDVASLGFNGDSTVGLGAVVCVENDSYDNTTEGSPDPDAPMPGQVFFYVYRGNAGSYGTASSGGERVPGAGGCAD